MKLILFLVMLALCLGCASTSAVKTCANGDRWEVRSNRLLWQTENVKVRAPDGTIVEVSKTGSDAEFIGAVAGAAVKAAK
jgi:hypothetical protein